MYCRRDPDGIFAEPVTDDIAPGYSALISIPMDLATVAKKIDMGQYESVGDFKSDFILMCNNAMTYNAPETVYYASAKRLLTTGLQIIAKVTRVYSIPYSRKYWRELNLAVEPKIAKLQEYWRI